MTFKLVTGGSYTPPSLQEMDMQLADDPLLIPTLMLDDKTLDSLTVAWGNANPAYIPHADNKIYLYEWQTDSWIKIAEKTLASSGTFTLSDLKEGSNHKLLVRLQTTLSPTNKTADSSPLDVWLDYILEIIETKDAGGTILEGALILALPADQLLSLISATVDGEDWPALAFKKCNRTDEYGTCSIRIPGGYKAAVLMIPDAEPTKGGDILAPVDTEET